MTLKSDLIALKALIDTLEAYRSMQCGVLGALSDSLPEEEGVTDADIRYSAMRDAILRAASEDGSLRRVSTRPHADIMAIFDRAIAAAGDA